MFKKLFNKKRETLFQITVNFDGEIYTTTATSGGIASILCDPYAEIISCEKL